jgi:hypothetical protein
MMIDSPELGALVLVGSAREVEVIVGGTELGGSVGLGVGMEWVRVAAGDEVSGMVSSASLEGRTGWLCGVIVGVHAPSNVAIMRIENILCLI